MRVVYEHGRPSHFQEEEPRYRQSALVDSVENENETDTVICKHSQESAPGRQLRPGDACLNPTRGSDNEVSKGRVVVTNTHTSELETEKLVNVFLSHDQPQLNPASEDFDPKSWLKNFMGIMTANQASYPKQVAGLAYKDLSVHAFWRPTHYQKTFWNQPLALWHALTQRVSRRRKFRKQILEDFDGLIKSGEMLLVLGRPGRQVISLAILSPQNSCVQWLFHSLKDDRRRIGPAPPRRKERHELPRHTQPHHAQGVEGRGSLPGRSGHPFPSVDSERNP